MRHAARVLSVKPGSVLADQSVGCDSLLQSRRYIRINSHYTFVRLFVQTFHERVQRHRIPALLNRHLFVYRHKGELQR